MQKNLKKYPERKVRKILVTLPTDQIEMLDNCSKAIGFNRSPFLALFLDNYADLMIAFTQGMLKGMEIYRQVSLKQFGGEPVGNAKT